jgi:TfoX/Sxy family transcriptional regulator of competence genes
MSELKAFLQGMLEDATRGLPSVTLRPYFGGHAAYAAGQVFALVSREPRLYVRFADAARHAVYLARTASEPGSESAAPPWVLVPEALHEDAEALGGWLREAHAQALAAPRPRRAPRKRAPARGR